MEPGLGDLGEENLWKMRPVIRSAVCELDPEVAWNLTDLSLGPRLHLMLEEMPGEEDAWRSWSPVRPGVPEMGRGEAAAEADADLAGAAHLLAGQAQKG